MIAGIFNRHKDEIDNHEYDHELDKILNIIEDGFNNVNGRFGQMDAEIDQIRLEVMKDSGSSFGDRLSSIESRVSSNSLGNSRLSGQMGSIEKEISYIKDELSYLKNKGIDKGTDTSVHVQINRLSDSIDSLSSRLSGTQESNNRLKEDLDHLNSEMRSYIDESINGSALRRVVDERIKESVDNQLLENENFKKVLSDISNNVTTKKQPVISSYDNVTTNDEKHTRITEGNNVATAYNPTHTVVTSRNVNKVLPSAVLPTFNALLNADRFLTYGELADMIGRKEPTARAYVNDLRNRGVSIDEQTRENGRKLVRLSKSIRQEHIIPE